MDNRTAAAVLADAKKARDAINALDLALDAEVKDIGRQAALERRVPSIEEEKRRDRLRADQEKLGEALTELRFVTLQQLDKSVDVERLKERLTAINVGLGANLDRLKAIARFADTAAKVTEGLANVVEKLAGVAV